MGRSILALKVESKIFDEVFKPLLDVELGKNFVKPSFNLDDNFPIVSKFNCIALLMQLIFSMFSTIFNVLGFVYREADGLRRHVPLFAHLGFLQNPH